MSPELEAALIRLADRNNYLIDSRAARAMAKTILALDRYIEPLGYDDSGLSAPERIYKDLEYMFGMPSLDAPK